MRGKYSPTVSFAYSRDQEWHVKYMAQVPEVPGVYNQYDPEGYDSYGYNEAEYDRAGNREDDYYGNDGDYDLDEDFNHAYDAGWAEWGFDGIKPVKRN